MSEIRVGVVDQGAASVAGGGAGCGGALWGDNASPSCQQEAASSGRAAAGGGGAPWGGNAGAEAGGRKRGVGGKNALTRCS